VILFNSYNQSIRVLYLYTLFLRFPSAPTPTSSHTYIHTRISIHRLGFGFHIEKVIRYSSPIFSSRHSLLNAYNLQQNKTCRPVLVPFRGGIGSLLWRTLQSVSSCCGPLALPWQGIYDDRNVCSGEILVMTPIAVHYLRGRLRTQSFYGHPPQSACLFRYHKPETLPIPSGNSRAMLKVRHNPPIRLLHLRHKRV
jgi:hypothetical protein